MENPQQQIIKSGIEKALSCIYKFSAEEVEMVVNSTENRQLKKREVILKPGQVCSFVIIVISGSLRLFNETHERENTLNLFCEYNFAADHESFVSQKPSLNSIEALENSLICFINIHKLHALIGRSHAFFAIGRVMQNWTKSTALAVNSDSPQASFEKLMELHPDWFLRFPQKYLASYLGMAPETFSRMKRKSLIS